MLRIPVKFIYQSFFFYPADIFIQVKFTFLDLFHSCPWIACLLHGISRNKPNISKQRNREKEPCSPGSPQERLLHIVGQTKLVCPHLQFKYHKDKKGKDQTEFISG